MATQITQQLTDIAAMETAFEQPSCLTYKPMVQYPTTGNPPTLDFAIPQASTFTTYGRLAKFIDHTWFKQFTKNVPTYNFFNYVKTLTPQAVTQLFHPNVATPAPLIGTFVPLAGAPNPATTSPATPRSGATGPTNYSRVGGAGSSLLSGATVRMATQANPVGMASASHLMQAVPDPAPVSAISNLAQQGIRGLYSHRIMNGGATVKYVAQPPVPVPSITIVEEYTTASYLGNYGAGKVIKTFTLLPGEKTTISVRTYQDSSTTRGSADNMLDSFSDSSATELDNMLQQEQGVSASSSGTNGGNDTSYNTYADSHNSQKSWNIGGSANLFGIVSVGGGYAQSDSDTTTSAGGMANSTNYSNTAVRASNMNTLANALNKHVQQSNANRQIDVNHTTSSTVSSGEEDVTIREIQNINLNRVLNFTFRQLLQEYTTVTWLSGLKFAYTNGYPESNTLVDLSNLPHMLADIIIDSNTLPVPPPVTYIDQIMCMLLKPYCSVLDYMDEPIPFVEAKVINMGACLSTWLPSCEPETETIWRKRKDCTEDYTIGDNTITFDGVILNVQKQVLLTSSLIGDAMLGAGDALDCFNQKVQDATAMSAYINNLQAMQQLENSIQNQTNDQASFTQNLTNDQDIVDQKLDIINNILTTPDPVTAATLYKKVNGDCCDVPQNTDCGGCGCA